MTATQRKVSVIVPTCDRPVYLREALSSIRALEGADFAFEFWFVITALSPKPDPWRMNSVQSTCILPLMAPPQLVTLD